MKRKSDHGVGQEVLWKRSAGSYILNVSGIHHVDFTPLSNIRRVLLLTSWLSYIIFVTDDSLKPRDSPNRMEHVCNQIPESLAGADLEVISYYRGCYQKFTKNPDRLKCSVTSNDRASTSRPPRKSSSSSAMQLFPPASVKSLN